MSHNPYQHIDLRVNDMEQAWAFYGKILPAIGFKESWTGESFRGFDAPGKLPDQAWFAFTEDRDHRPNRNRIAFRADTREEVDRIGQAIREAGAGKISGPRECPEYSRTYYAVFFEDPFGNCLEVCFRED